MTKVRKLVAFFKDSSESRTLICQFEDFYAQSIDNVNLADLRHDIVLLRMNDKVIYSFKLGGDLKVTNIIFLTVPTLIV